MGTQVVRGVPWNHGLIRHWYEHTNELDNPDSFSNQLLGAESTYCGYLLETTQDAASSPQQTLSISSLSKCPLWNAMDAIATRLVTYRPAPTPTQKEHTRCVNLQLACVHHYVASNYYSGV